MKQEPNKDEYWFKAKKYGYGWSTPTRWQGWLTVALYSLTLLAIVLWFVRLPEERVDQFVWLYLLLVGVVSTIFVLVVRAHGPPAKWRWGSRDDTDEK